MLETILNIYLIINNNLVIAFKAKAYEREGGDDNKIKFLKERAREDLKSAYTFDAPINSRGEYMSYKKFSKFEKQGMHYKLFENIFSQFKVPENPLICVTPIVNGEFYGE